MPFWAYIIQSESTGRYYCGHSSDPNRHLRQHNDPEYRLSKTTKRFEGPWMLIWSQDCQTGHQEKGHQALFGISSVGRVHTSLMRDFIAINIVFSTG